MIIIAGPCVVESKEVLRECASVLYNITSSLDVDFYFKSSYKKANRSDVSSFTGIGDVRALEYLNEIREEFNIPVMTDIHSAEEAMLAAKYVDVIQIPAFLCRQTEILQAAGRTGKIVNIKKGQFVSPHYMIRSAEKITSTGNNKIWLTERGTFFGYQDLVVDFRSLILMRESGYPVIYDATHSVQQPYKGKITGGLSEFIIPLARSATMIGVDGIFFETHPDPSKALSDSGSQLHLSLAEKLIQDIIKINKLFKELD